MKNKCENCRYYNHKPNILGGIAECLLDVKPLKTFQVNEACDKYRETSKDNLKVQNDFYKEHLDGVLKIRK